MRRLPVGDQHLLFGRLRFFAQQCDQVDEAPQRAIHRGLAVTRLAMSTAAGEFQTFQAAKVIGRPDRAREGVFEMGWPSRSSRGAARTRPPGFLP